MRSSTVFTSLLYATLATSLPQPLRPRSKGFVSLPVSVKLPASDAERHADRQRARALAARDVLAAPLTNRNTFFTAAIGVGNPPTEYNLLVDTMSSNTWVGANTPYAQTQTSQSTDQTVSVSYALGSFSGMEFIDRITYGDDGTTFLQSIGVAVTASDTFKSLGLDGVLGVGPTGLTIGTLSPDTGASIPTVVDNQFSQGVIQQNLMALSFAPVVNGGKSVTVTGAIDFGDVDPSKFATNILFTPIAKDLMGPPTWSIDAAIELNGQIVVLGPGVIDSSITTMGLTSTAFQTFLQLSGATVDQTTGAVTISKDQFFKMPNVDFVIQGTLLSLVPDTLAVPESLRGDGPFDDVMLQVSDIGQSAIQFVLGYSFLERVYLVLDTGNSQVGFAMTVLSNNVVNVPVPVISDGA